MDDGKNHNLNIHMYSMDEIFGLFNLPYHFTIDHLKAAKKKVLMTHPDKSKLPPEYFLFYKKAFDIVVQFYESNQKQNQAVTAETTEYNILDTTNINKATKQKISSSIGEMSSEVFQSKFNQLFEENMSKKPDSRKNEWFVSENNAHQMEETVNAKNMGQVFERIKEKQAGLVQYRGVENFIMDSGNRLYDDEEDQDGQYRTSDPFSKLKYDDLRKVHKDQTVFSVSERDFQKVPQYSSVDHFVRERGKQTLTPLEKKESQFILDSQEAAFRERMMKREYAAKLETMKYEEKNKSVLSSFLRLM